MTYIQRQLGHASIQLMVDTYGKWLPMGNKAAVDRLDAVSSEPCGSKMVATAAIKAEDVSNSLNVWSRRLESNQRPAVYETAALPTELRRRWKTRRRQAGTGRRYDSEEIAGVSIVVFCIRYFSRDSGTPADLDVGVMDGTHMGRCDWRRFS